jgi:hypothetical protein
MTRFMVLAVALALPLALLPGSARAIDLNDPFGCNKPIAQLRAADVERCAHLSDALGNLPPTADELAAVKAQQDEDEARKSAARAAHHYADPGAVSLCPPPHHMTRDGCQ